MQAEKENLSKKLDDARLEEKNRNKRRESFIKAQGQLEAQQEILEEKTKKRDLLLKETQVLKEKQENELQNLSLSTNAEKKILDGKKIFKKN